MFFYSRSVDTCRASADLVGSVFSKCLIVISLVLLNHMSQYDTYKVCVAVFFQYCVPFGFVALSVTVVVHNNELELGSVKHSKTVSLVSGSFWECAKRQSNREET